MADDPTLEELRAIHDELHRLREENEEMLRMKRSEAARYQDGDGSRLSRMAREATEGFR